MAESGEGSSPVSPRNYTMPGDRARELTGLPNQNEGFFKRIVKRLVGTPARAGATAVVTAGVVAGGVAAEATAHPVETAVGNVTDAVVRRVEDIQHAGEQVVDVNSGLYGKFLIRREDGTLVISGTPQVVEVKYTPHADPTSRYWNEDNIVVHQKPEADLGKEQNIPADEIKATHAIRVTGGAFGGQTEVGRFEVDIDGKKYIVGEWFQPSNEQGNPVNLNGEPLKEGEDPYFVAASFASVIFPSIPQAQGE